VPRGGLPLLNKFKYLIAKWVTGANFRANWVALGRGGSDKFGKWRDLGADHAEARTQVFIE
jgi:hypothetical protein